MKKLTLILVIVLFSTLTFAQKLKKKDVPAEIKSAFQKQFPAAKRVKWTKEDSNFEAGFDQNDTEHSALFDAQGSLLATAFAIEATQLPSSVLEYLSTKYAGQRITEVSKITDAKGTINYEVKIKDTDLIFDGEGKFIKEVKD
ncbi:MAG: PepSY-like domain-containing protein [Verrucomicrobia bacterium]|nr:PepSY-like domain-containing protein [Cytophagales bacterium]